MPVGFVRSSQIGDFIRLADAFAQLIIDNEAVRTHVEANLRDQARRHGVENAEIVGPIYHEFGLGDFDPFDPLTPGWTIGWKGHIHELEAR